MFAPSDFATAGLGMGFDKDPSAPTAILAIVSINSGLPPVTPELFG